MAILRKPAYLFASLITLTGMIALYLCLSTRRFCDSNFSLIRNGMTTYELDEIRMRPPDFVDGGDSRVDAFWIEPDGSKIVVTFDGEGRVTGKEFFESDLPFHYRAWFFFTKRPSGMPKDPSDHWWSQWSMRGMKSE